MRILITGITARGCGSTRVKYDYVTHVYLLRDALKQLGHDVISREVQFGEPLREFDFAFVVVAPTQSLSSYHPVGMAWTLRQMGTKAMMVFDDWSCERLGRDWRSTVERGEAYFRWRHLEGAPAGHKQLIHHVLNQATSDRCPWPVLAPMFTWGQHDMVLDLNAKLYWWDVSPLVSIPEFKKRQPKDRHKRWVSATLQQKDSWLLRLPNKWPILEVGNKRQEQPVLKEADVIQTYAENWGVLCAPYTRAGSGWWRARYNYAIATKSILYLDPRDHTGLAEVFTYPLYQIEGFNQKEMVSVAEAQAAWFEENTWTLMEAYENLDTVIKRYC
jgi:hypothetical protein